MAASMDAELDQLFATVSRMLALLAEPRRLKSLNGLLDGEHSVSDLVDRIQLTQTNDSRQLNFMFSRGVLTRRPEGALTFHSIADKMLMTLCRAACMRVAARADDRKLPAKAIHRFMTPTRFSQEDSDEQKSYCCRVNHRRARRLSDRGARCGRPRCAARLRAARRLWPKSQPGTSMCGPTAAVCA